MCVCHPHTAKPLCSRGLGDKGHDVSNDASPDLGSEGEELRRVHLPLEDGEETPSGQPPWCLADSMVWWAIQPLDHTLPVGHLVKHLTGLVVKQVIWETPFSQSHSVPKGTKNKTLYCRAVSQEV